MLQNFYSVFWINIYISAEYANEEFHAISWEDIEEEYKEDLADLVAYNYIWD